MAAHDFLLPAEVMDVGQPTDADLDLLFDSSADDETVEPVRRWAPVDDRGAEWAMRKLAAAAADVETMSIERDRMINEIVTWFEARTKRSRDEVAHWEAVLFQYGVDQHEDHGRKTIDLPSGKITSSDRRETAAPEIIDPAAAAAWAVETLDADTVGEVVPPQPPKVLVSKLKDHVEIVDGKVIDVNGTEVPGVVVKYGDLTTKVKPR